MKTLYYADPAPGATGYGWATANRELKKALAAHFEIVPMNVEIVRGENGWDTLKTEMPDIVFMPVDSAFRPLSKERGKVNVCLNFFESPLEPCARENAAKFDVCFVGSTWCKERCAERGIHNVRVLIQGVDGDIFKPQPPRAPDGTIRIFSGGKFEYRKGQDLVIAAFSEFLKSHPTAHLVCAWHNPWPQLAAELINRMGVPFSAIRSGNQEHVIAGVMEYLGIPRESFTILPQLTQQGLADEMARTDFGLFPNRCEGGNNLVMQEYLNTGRPAVANLKTGQADLAGSCIYEITAEEDAAHWAVQSVEEIVIQMKECAKLRIFNTPTNRWTWEAAARTVLDACS